MTSNDEYVLQLLREQGYVTAEQLEVASRSMREGNETTLDVLVASAVVSEDDVLGVIADQFGLKYVSIDPSAMDPEVGKTLNAELAHKYGVVPVMKDADTLTVALSDPMGFDAVDSLRYVMHGLDVQAVLAPAAEVKAAMEKLYPSGADEVLTRRSRSRPPTLIWMRPSCGMRFSEILIFDMILIRERIAPCRRLGGESIFLSAPSMR